MPSNNSNNDSKTYFDEEYSFNLGLGLAVLSTLFIGSSFIIKKKALIKINKLENLRAGAGGLSYLKEWIWWAGFLSMGIGEIENFAAYAFAPASLITPMGVLSVLVSAVLASKFLNEKLNFLGKMGCVLCILGSTVIVIHAPRGEEVESVEELLEKLRGCAFITYAAIIAIISFSIYYYFGPKYGHVHVSVYVLLCSAVGSLTVMACKGLGIAIKESITRGTNELGNAVTWMFLMAVVLCVTIQMNYLNRALDLFNTGIVTPVYYVMFTSLVIVASAILYGEWKNMSWYDVLGGASGFSTVIIGIILLNGFKDFDIAAIEVVETLRTRQKNDSTARGNTSRETYFCGEQSPLSAFDGPWYGVADKNKILAFKAYFEGE